MLNHCKESKGSFHLETVTKRGTAVKCFFDQSIRAWRLYLSWLEGDQVMVPSRPICITDELAGGLKNPNKKALEKFILEVEKLWRVLPGKDLPTNKPLD